MYVPPHFNESDMTEIKRFIRAHEFATVISQDSGRPVASHLLLELQEDSSGSLRLAGHMARANPLWRTFAADGEVLVVFFGAHAYISPTWYSVESVPTWDYRAVHVYGRPRVVEEGDELKEILGRLVDSHEAAEGFHLGDLPVGMVDQMIKGIVGFTIAVTSIEASSKLSQNNSPEDFDNIIERLRERADHDSHEVAEAMERIRRLKLGG